MPYLVVYDSSRADSKLTALTALYKYPTASVKDFSGLTVAQINTYVGNLDAATYDKIIFCVNNTRVEEVRATGTLTVTEGAANEVGTVLIDNGVLDPFPIGYVAGAATGSYADAIALTASINAGTSLHGYSATRADAVITVTAPVGSGAGANAFAMTADVDTGGTLAIAITNDIGDGVAGVTAVGVSGDMAAVDFIAAEPAMLNAYVATGTAAGVANGTITLATGSSAVDDYYNGMTIFITAGGTGPSQVRTITDYDGATRIATIDFNWYTNPTGNTYIISEDLLEFSRTVGSILPARRIWTELMTGQPYELPTLLNILGGATETYWCAKNDKTSTSMAAGSLSDTAEFVAGAYNAATHEQPFYVAIKSSTEGGVGEIIKITSNTANTLTLAHNWKDTPAAASVYQIGRKNQMLWDEYLELAMETYANFSGDTYPSIAVATFQKIVDKYKGVAAGRRTIHDGYEELEEMAELGKVIFKAKAEGVVS